MNVGRGAAALVGALFLIAMVASLVGGGLVEAAMSAPGDPTAISAHRGQLIAGILLELVNAIAVLGIGVFMFPFLAIYHRTAARGYLGLRLVEAVFCGAIVIGPLALLTLSEHQLQAGTTTPGAYDGVAALAMAERAAIVSLLIPIFFCLGGLVLYTALLQAALLPRFITIWGLVAVTLILALNLLALGVKLEMTVALSLALPIILNEIFMGGWLIFRGFSTAPPKPL